MRAERERPLTGPGVPGYVSLNRQAAARSGTACKGRVPVRSDHRLRGANSERETRWFAVLFRKCLSVLAVQFGFDSSTRRPLPLLNRDGAADPAADRSWHADAAELVDPGLRRGRANGG